MPISISDATLTLMGGSVLPGLALWSVGHQTTIREIEALLHFWRYVGHLLGVQPTWYPMDFRQGVQLICAAFVKRAYTAGPAGKELVESYLPAFAPKPGTSLRTARRSVTPGFGCSRPATAGTRCPTRGPGRCMRWSSFPSSSRWRASVGCWHRWTAPPISAALAAKQLVRERDRGPGGRVPTGAEFRR